MATAFTTQPEPMAAVKYRPDYDPNFPWAVMDNKGRILNCSIQREYAERFLADKNMVSRHIARHDDADAVRGLT